MRIHFIRHGHSDHNQAYDITHDTNVYKSFEYRHSHLTEKGKEQIRSIQLPEIPNRVYCSPLVRCIETARVLFGDKTILYLYDGLMETQGPFPCNWRDNYDVFIRSMKRYNLVNISTTYYPSKVEETAEQMKQRATLCFEAIKNDAKDFESIVIITHNDWLESVFGRKFSNGEVYSIVI